MTEIIWLLALNVVNGGLAAWIILDAAHRRSALAELRRAEKEMASNASKLGELHNEIGKKMLDIEERVSAHDYQLNNIGLRNAQSRGRAQP